MHWELVNLFAGTKNFSCHICYDNIGWKHNKILWNQETGSSWTDRTEQYTSKEECINKEETFTQGFKDCRKIKRKVPQNLDDLQNLLLKPAQGKRSYFMSLDLIKIEVTNQMMHEHEKTNPLQIQRKLDGTF